MKDLDIRRHPIASILGKELFSDVLEDAVALAGVSKFPARIKCALLGWMAFKDAAVRITTTNRGE